MGVLDGIKDLKNDKDLTIEDVKSCKGLENLTDKEAEEVIRSIKTYTRVIYILHLKINGLAQNLQEKDVSLDNSNPLKQAA